MAAQNEPHLYSLPYERVSMESNNYNDLENKPKINGVTLAGDKSLTELGIPTKTSELTNDSGFITSGSVPTKVSELTNDLEFTTKTYVDNAINALSNILSQFDDITVVETLNGQATFSSTFDNLATNITSQLTTLKTALEANEYAEIKALTIASIGNVKPSHTIIIDSSTDVLSLIIDWQGCSYSNNVVSAIDIVGKKVLNLTMTNDTPADDSFVSYFEDSTAYTFTIEYALYKQISTN